MLSCTWEHVSLLFLQCPSETFQMLEFRLELGLWLSTPKSQLAFPPNEEIILTECPEVEWGPLGHFHLRQLWAVNHSMQTVSRLLNP